VWGGASGHTYTFTRQPNGTTNIDVGVLREGKDLKGWALGLVLGTGRRVLERRLKTLSRPSKSARARRERQAHREPGTPYRRIHFAVPTVS